MNSEIEAREEWLALMIGNSRLHWALFVNRSLVITWDTAHCFMPQEEGSLCQILSDSMPVSFRPQVERLQQPFDLWMASVVPTQTAFWQRYSRLHEITLEQIPLQAIYPTFGIDRALAVWSVLIAEDSPALVIDAGTALTFTGADQTGRLLGGAILPGLQLQLRSLSANTEALPLVDARSLQQLPPRWATNTREAIQSGVIYTMLAGLRSFIDDWLQTFPDSAIALTGGDSAFLHRQLYALDPDLGSKLKVDPHLIFRGMAAIRNRRSLQEN